MKEWSEAKKFSYESIRMLVLAILGFLATFIIVQPWENKIDEEVFLKQEYIKIKNEVITSFLKTSYVYSSSIYKVLFEKGTLDDDTIAVYELSYNNYRVDLNRMILYFRIRESREYYALVTKSNELRYKLRQIYNGEVDSKGWRLIRTEFIISNNKLAEIALKSIAFE